MTKFIIAPSARPQGQKKPAPKKRPQFPQQRDARTGIYKARPVRRGR